MKKLTLTSLVALFATAGVAGAANVIDGNPMYRPATGHFYSVTSLDTTTDFDAFTLGEEFGFGITNKLSAVFTTAATEENEFDVNSWDDFSFGLNYRAFEMNNWKADIYGNLNIGEIWGDHADFLDEDRTFYNWTAGVRAGYVATDWTLAARAEFHYINTEAFNWGDDGAHNWTLGVDGQYLIDANWNIVAGVQYDTFENDFIDDTWMGTLGINYNIDATKFVGAYLSQDLAADDWDVWGLGVKFGIDF